MADTVTILRLFAGIVLLLGNGYFVTIEFAMTRVRQFEEAAFQGSRGLERAWEMTERLEIYLSGCQLGITICSVGLGIAAEPALAAVIDPVIRTLGLEGVLGGGQNGGHTVLSAVVAYGIINILHLTIGEQAPTYLGIERSKSVAKYGAPILYWWTRAFGPVIWFADWLAKSILSLFGVEITRSWAEEELEEGEEEGAGGRSRGELMARMGDALSGAGLPEERRREVMNALAIDRIQVSDIMVDGEDAVTVSTENSTAENFEAIRGEPHTRFPLVGEGGLDDVVGVVYVQSLLDNRSALDSGEATFADVAVDALVLPADLPVSEAIDEFQAANQELAVVEDDGAAVGILTATDAFEAIAGELEDPLDAST